MAKESQTRVDRQISWIKNHKIMSVFVVVGIILIGLGTLTDALTKLFGLFSSPTSNPAKILSIEELAREVAPHLPIISSYEIGNPTTQTEILSVEELKREVACFAGLAEALKKSPNYSDAMNACKASRVAVLFYYNLRQNDVQVPIDIEIKFDTAFRQTLDALKSREDMTNFEELYKSTKRRYDGFLLMREKGTSAITPRMREVWKEL